MYEYKVKFDKYDLEEYSSALTDCQNIVYEIVDDSNMRQFHDEALEIVIAMTKLARKIEDKLEYESLTKDDFLSIKADEEYARKKEE